MDALDLPTTNKEPGNSGHTTDHNKIVTSISTVARAVTGLEQNPPQIMGTVGNESQLPGTGMPGQLYFVGTEGDLWGYDSGESPPWSAVGNITGPRGSDGAAGSIIGVLANGATPPAGTPAGTLWFMYTSGGGNPPPVTTSPQHVGSYSKFSGSQTSTTLSIGSPQDGDVGVLMVVGNSGTTANYTTPTGWTMVSETMVSGSWGTKLYVKTLSASDTSVTIAGTAFRRAYAVEVLRNVTLTGAAGSEAPHAFTKTTSGSASGSHAAPSVTISGSVPSTVVTFYGERIGSDYASYTGDTVFTAPAAQTLGGSSGAATDSAVRSVSAASSFDTGVDAVTGAVSAGNWGVTHASVANTTEFAVWSVAVEAA